MKIKIKKPTIELDKVDNRKLLKAPVIGTPITTWPDSLKNAVAAWKYLGNSWMTSMECNMTLSTKGVRFETDIDLNDIRLLEHLGYMEHSQLGFQDFWCRRYKLNERGLRLILKTIEEPKEEKTVQATAKFKVKKSAELKTKTGKLLTVGSSCPYCKGSGWDEEIEDECFPCLGIGVIQSIVGKSNNLLPGKRETSKNTVKTVKRK